MNIEERAAQAAAWKAAGQCNCAQAVLKAFEDKLPVDADTLMAFIASGGVEKMVTQHFELLPYPIHLLTKAAHTRPEHR